MNRRRPLLPMTTLVTASLLALAGCSGSSSDSGSESSDHRAEHTASKPASKPAAVLTETQLGEALLTPAEAKNYTAKDNAGPAVQPKTDKAECSPLADMTATGTNRAIPAKAWVSRTYGSKEQPGLAVTTSLLSYEGEGAEETVAAVRKALGACKDGFSTTGNNGGATVKYASVRTEQAQEVGDESLTWQMIGEAQGTQVPFHFTAVREGNTLAVFLTLHLTDPTKAELPADLLKSQLDKVAKAQTN